MADISIGQQDGVQSVPIAPAAESNADPVADPAVDTRESSPGAAARTASTETTPGAGAESHRPPTESSAAKKSKRKKRRSTKRKAKNVAKKVTRPKKKVVETVKKKRKRKTSRQKGVNKSEHIRNILRRNPNATPTEIRETLERQGIEVSQGLISVVKYGGREKTGRRKKRRKAVVRRPGAAAAISAADLIQAKKLADQLGGVRQALAALAALEQLR